ncbi:MAG TPA: hypothetical protein VJ997_11250 [Longimicrobiales bacterium]|nr:hypothetical protein [Longimicrobiales bacterium]
MISGKVALGGLSLEFGNAQKRFDELAARVRELSEAQTALLEEERGLFERLAHLYLPELSPEAVSSGLSEIRSRLLEVLDGQRTHRAKLDTELGRMPGRMAEIAEAVEASEAEEARMARALDEARGRVEEHLGAEPAYRTAVERHQAAMERRALLKDRRARLQAAANVERARYEGYRPFAYLHGRAFGEPEYRGGAVARLFDGWLARRTDFARMARHYRILRTGPYAIQAEIHRLTKHGAELEQVIDELQSEADQRCGLSPALEAAAAAQEKLVADRAALAAATERRDALAAEAREIEANRGAPYEEAIQLHRDFLESQTVLELLRLARSTPDPRDDELVTKVERVRKRLEGVNQELVAQRQELERLAGRAGGVADLARSAVERFSSRRSHFPEEFRMGDLVRSVFDGSTDPHQAITEIHEAHVGRQVLASSEPGPWGAWFAELSADFDRELGATTLEITEEHESESEVILKDARGRVIHRRVTRRRRG